MDLVEDWKTNLDRCVRCGLCRFACPTLLEGTPGWESTGPRGKMLMLKAYRSGEAEANEFMVKELYTCTLCCHCKEICPCDIDVCKVFEEAREELNEKGKAPLKQHSIFVSSIERNYNPYSEPHKDRLKKLHKNSSAKKNPEVIYFTGCTAAYRHSEIFRATQKIMRHAGVDFTVLDDEWCCGSPLLRVGERTLAEKMARHNVDQVRCQSAKTVVFACAGCYMTFRNDYPNLLGEDLGFKVLHMTEFLDMIMSDGKLKLGSVKPTRVTYHDPCHLGRYSKIYESPRRLLQSIPEVKLVEMGYNREDALCCGGGGGLKSAFNKLALNIAERRVRQAVETGAEMLVSSCPFCKTNLKDADSKKNHRIRIVDLMELIAESVQSA